MNPNLVEDYTESKRTIEFTSLVEASISTADYVRVRQKSKSGASISIREASTGISYELPFNQWSELLDGSLGVLCTKDSKETSYQIELTEYNSNRDVYTSKDQKNILGGLFGHRQKSPSARYARGCNYYILCDDVPRTGIALVFTNWYSDSLGDLTEKGTGANISITASIEYPMGTYTRITFSSETIGSIPDAGELVSDFCIVDAKKGEKIGVRFWLNTPNGMPFCPDRWSGQNGSVIEYGASVLSDTTLGGSIKPSIEGYGFSIAAGIAMTSCKSAIVFGDSKAYGLRDTPDNTMALGNVCRGLRAEGVAYCNCSIGGDSWQNFKINGAKKAALAKYFSNSIFQYGQNDLMAGQELGRIQSSILKSIQLLPSNVGVFLCTPSPATTSTDDFISDVNQTVTSYETVRLEYDNWIRTLPYGIDGMFDIHAAESTIDADGVSLSGKWKYPGMTDAGIHETRNGAKLIVAARTFAIERLKEPGYIKDVYLPKAVTLFDLTWIDAGSKTITITPNGLDVIFTKQGGATSTTFSSVTVAAGDSISLKTTVPYGIKLYSLTGVAGTMPIFSGMDALTTLSIEDSDLTGDLPDPRYHPELTNYTISTNDSTLNSSRFYSFNYNTKIQTISMSKCSLTGNIPDLSVCTELVNLIATNGSMIGWDRGTLPPTIKTIDLRNNSLTTNTVNAFLAAALASGGTAMTINMTGNAAPTGQGITDKAQLITNGNTVSTE